MFKETTLILTLFVFTVLVLLSAYWLIKGSPVLEAKKNVFLLIIGIIGLSAVLFQMTIS